MITKKAGTRIPFAVASAEDSPGFLLWQITMLWQRRIRASLKPLGLTHVQFVLLAGLAWLSRPNKPVSQVALAKHARLDVMMTSQVVRTLEKKGLLTRIPHPVDPRAKSLALTKAGKVIVDVAVPAVEKTDKDFFSPILRRQKAINISFLALIKQNDLDE